MSLSKNGRKILLYLVHFPEGYLITGKQIYDAISISKEDYEIEKEFLLNEVYIEKIDEEISLMQKGRDCLKYGEQNIYFDRLPLVKPISQPKPTPKSQKAIRNIASLLSIILKHPLWSAIIAGLILLVLSHFIFGSP